MSVWRLIAEDLRAWKRMGFLGPAGAQQPVRAGEALRLWWHFAGVRATVLFRLSHAAYRRRLPLLPTLLAHAALRRYGLDVPPHVPVGPGLYIPHPVGTVITARGIGRNCQIITAVTIGMRNRHEFPLIGDDVVIGAGARVLGGITIGDGARIGANAVVLADVPAGATAVGIPAHIVTHTPATADDEAELAVALANNPARRP
jgi:serine O-acetyltransferase